tara:strand:- start:1113 stop:1505 length:393 start_codon:yes stop_codon:yes gene_type:complete
VRIGMTPAETAGSGDSGFRQAIAVVGGLAAAVAASSCCIAPLVLFSLGIGGAWIGNLTALAPYQPVFLALAAGFLAYGYHLIYRRSRKPCDDGCARPLPGRLTKGGLWIAASLVATAVIFPWVAPRLLGI